MFKRAGVTTGGTGGWTPCPGPARGNACPTAQTGNSLAKAKVRASEAVSTQVAGPPMTAD